jgi:hypothetical protein
MRYLAGWIALLASLPLHAGSPLLVRDAWIREAPPGMEVLAAYMTIENRGTREQRLVSASSADFTAVEIHTTQISNGTASMTRQTSLALPAGGNLVFAPGGNHLMLMHPQRALRAGDQVTLTLRFNGNLSSTVHATVRNDATMTDHHHH